MAAVVASALALVLAPGAWAQTPGGPGRRVGTIRVEPGHVFTTAQRAENPFFQAADFLHHRTRREVIAREVLLAPGDPYDPELVAESERNIRALDFIAWADIEEVFRPEGMVDLVVRTRDKFTLRAELSASQEGGETKQRVSLGETNLLGHGKELKLDRESRGEKSVERVKFKDPRLWGSRWQLKAQAGQTDEGEDFALGVGLPFYSRDAPWALGADARYSADDQDFFDAGRSVASADRRSQALRLEVGRSWGMRAALRRLHLVGEYEDSDFGRLEGSPPAGTRVPGDTQRIEASLEQELLLQPRFIEAEEIDQVDRVQDLAIGETLAGKAGLLDVREVARGEAHPGSWALRLSTLRELGGHALWTAGGLVEGHTRGGEATAWDGAGFVRAYYRGVPFHTLAGSFTVDAVEVRDGLTRQLTLGEDNGLRGYEPRQLVGEKRVRLNLEDRIFTDLRLLSVRFGAAVFFDSGTAVRRSEDLAASDFINSVGVGLRMGSAPLIGDKVFRLDVAFPLDRVNGEREGVSVSLSTGQMFTIFQVSEGLGEDL
ncbi:MAG: BamA/TamA family outer membrane protein [Planctomycetes bacterium]|nr:BamA/TamA family outer membrane protein [Planctomycetota bacterium]